RRLGVVSLGPETAANRFKPAGSSQKMSDSYKLNRRSGTSEDSRDESQRSSDERRQDYTDRRYRRGRRSNGGTEEHNGTYRGKGKGQGRRYPDRWANYDPIGKEMTGTRFVAFKCPLKEDFFAHDTHPDEFFDIHTLVGYARDAQRRLGLVVDLTNTDRYYNKDVWYDYDVEYRKLFCPGHEVNGREDIVEQFNGFVDDFLAKNKDNDKLIGVHCTHGINRTGYLICRYLIDRQDWNADEAIRVFEECRGHTIEREKYKDTLREAQRRRDRARTEKDDKDAKTDEPSTSPPSETEVPPPPHFDEPDDASEAAPAAESLPPPPTF
ncbi:hypothetical protein PMAYCL1PPCAC_06392, partial [Pristionchus mayeri]